LQSGGNTIDRRVRRPGGGRKRAVAHQPGLPAALEAIIEAAIRGDPCSPLRWVSRSQRQLVKSLAERGFKASQRVVANLLRALNYSCQANSKTREGGKHPDRDAQFNHINATVKAAINAGEPAISVDTKKKELVGDFKNNGRELRPKGHPPSRARSPEAVRVHDFKIPELGKVAPYGVYDIAANHGWVSVGVDADTAAFAVQAFASRCASASKRRVESIRRWWYKLGRARYPGATCLMITADCGGSNGVASRWSVIR
jgi:Rhodopirellula transposase DDE domain